jgi:hypothetical protein
MMIRRHRSAAILLAGTLLALCGCTGDARPSSPQEIRTVTLIISSGLDEQTLEVRLDEAPAVVIWRSGERKLEGALDEVAAEALRSELSFASSWSLPSTVGGHAFDGSETRMIVDTSSGTSAVRVRSWREEGEYSTWQAARHVVDLVDRHAAAALQ